MSRKSSTFIKETRDREAWLKSAAERGGSGGDGESEKLIAVAALMRGAHQAVQVPEEAEERSRARGVQYMQQSHMERLGRRSPVAPWYLRLGRLMRYVFTLGRRR